MSAKIITIYNHKGGVGKTPLTYCLGWTLCEMGKKVLLVDGDPQANLTTFVNGSPRSEKPDLFAVNLDKYATVYEWFGHFLYAGKDKPTKPIFSKEQNSMKFPGGRGKLDLLCGSLDTGVIDLDLPLQLAQTGGNNAPAQFQKALRSLAAKDYDVILIDLSPSVGYFNLLNVFSSDYWIAPVFPNHFCLKAMGMLESIITRFNDKVAPYKKTDSKLDGFDIHFKFLGYVTQNYRPNVKAKNDEAIVNAFNAVKEAINIKAAEFARYLLDFQRSLTETAFKQYFPDQKPFNLANISDFNRFGPMAQKYGIVPFRLTKSILIADNDNDQIKQDDMDRMKGWEDEYKALAERIIKLP